MYLPITAVKSHKSARDWIKILAVQEGRPEFRPHIKVLEAQTPAIRLLSAHLARAAVCSRVSERLS